MFGNFAQISDAIEMAKKAQGIFEEAQADIQALKRDAEAMRKAANETRAQLARIDRLLTAIGEALSIEVNE